MSKDVFTGPVGIAIGYDDPALLAKKILAFVKNNEKLEIKGGIIEGRVCETDAIKSLSELPSREVLLSMFIGAVQSPMSKLAAALNATLARFSYAMTALKDNKSN